VDGHVVDHSSSNQFGGENHTMSDGEMFQTIANPFGGQEIIGSHGITGHTSQVGSGPVNLFDQSGLLKASAWPDTTGFHARFFS
jgi:hypothetical protein